MNKKQTVMSPAYSLAQFSQTLISKATKRIQPELLESVLVLLLLCMFPLGFLESLRWPLPPPKATHGILKGLSLVVVMILVFFRHRLPRGKKTLETVVVGVFLFSFIISSIFSLSPETSMLFLWYPCIAFLYVYVLQIVRIKEAHITFLIGVSTLLVMGIFMFAIFSIFSRYEVDNVYYFMFLDHRANYFLEEIRKAGKYASLGPYFMLVPLIASLISQPFSTKIQKLSAFVVLCVAVLTAVISNNRIDVLVIGIQMFIMMWFIPRRLAIVLLLLVIPISSFGLSVANRYFGFNLEERILRPHLERDLETIDMRYVYWQTAFYNFREHPILGTGPNTYNDVSDFPLRRYYDAGSGQYTVKADEGIGIHNIFIERLADTGLVGFFAFIWVLMYYFREDVLALVRRKGVDRARYVFFALSSWSWVLYGITDNGYGAQGFVTFFFLRGLLHHL